MRLKPMSIPSFSYHRVLPNEISPVLPCCTLSVGSIFVPYCPSRVQVPRQSSIINSALTMGRRKARSKRKKQPEWDLDDEHRMLGCLDCHIERGTTDRAVLEETIRRYFEEFKEKKFSLMQIDARLQQMQDIASSRQKRRHSIFAKGSQVLKNIGPWDTKAIREYKESVRDHVIATIIHSDGRNLRDTPQRMQREHSKGPTSAMPTPNKRKYDSAIQQPTEGGNRYRKRPERSRATALQPRELKEEPSSTRESSRIPSHDQIVPDSDGVSSDDRLLLSDATVYVLQGPSCQIETDARVTAKTAMEEELESLKKKHEALQSRLQDKLHEVSIMHSRTAQELQTVRGQYEEAAETVIALKRAVSEVDQRRGTEFTKALAYQERQIASLEMVLKKTQNTAFFTRLTSHTPFRPSEADIHNGMTKIRIESKKLITPLQDCTLLLPTLDRIGDDYLLSLLHRSSGLWVDHGVRLESFLTDLAQLGLEVTLCALTTAALCEWVFADNFESDATGPSLLLDFYQHHISMADGKLALRNLDMAARCSFFQSEDYRRIQIPCRAETLARRLVDAFAPLVTSLDTPPLRTSGLDIYDELLEIFTVALGLKANLLVSSDRFTVLLPRPGSKFDPTWMQAESKEGFQLPKVTLGRARAQVCILPGILAYDESDNEPPDYRLELRDSLGNRSNMHILHKAVVII
ncbi:hypothetical protein BJX96DRAFT_47934 [Aspergillus floccosus]